MAGVHLVPSCHVALCPAPDRPLTLLPVHSSVALWGLSKKRPLALQREAHGLRGEPGLEQAELKEIESELPAACGEAGKVSREPASEPGGRERQLVSEPELALFPSQSPELRDGAGLCSPPSLSICLHLREK